jgi:[acyl-carrier-protein] S-malonyltransferase
MGQALVARSPLAKQIFAQASEVLGYDLLKLCLEGPADELNRTEFSQPALFVHSFAALKELEQERSDLWSDLSSVAGLSLGEYTAVTAAGGIQFEDGVRLVQIRGKAMQSAADQVDSGMASILGLAREALEEICEQSSSADSYVQVANLLCPGNIAISGHLEALQNAENKSVAAGAMRTVRLQVAGAFHTEIMRPAVALLESALDDVEFKATRVPVISNVDANAHTEPQEIRALLARQVVSTVLWEDSLRKLLESGVNEFIEVGTGRVLAGTLKRVQRKIPCENYGD